MLLLWNVQVPTSSAKGAREMGNPEFRFACDYDLRLTTND